MRLPPIDKFPPERDPAHANWQDLFSVPSRPSLPSVPQAQSTETGADALYRYLYPIDPRKNDRVVIGVHTRGTQAAPKKHLKPIYDLAGLPFCCHSCDAKIPEIVANNNGCPTPTGLYSLIGDHQPPTVIYELLANPGKLANSIFGKLGRAAFLIQQNDPPLTLYEFKVDGILFQTNSRDLSVWLSHQEPRAVSYGCSDQFLYPHCEACSNAQGRQLW